MALYPKWVRVETCDKCAGSGCIKDAEIIPGVLYAGKICDRCEGMGETMRIIGDGDEYKEDRTLQEM